MKRNVLLFVLSGALAGPGAGAALQTPTSDLARQHLESGIQFYNQQRYKQALNDFQIIVTSMAESDYADDALLQIGKYYLEVEEDFDKALENFKTVLQRYPTQDSAPGAYYYLGETTLRASRSSQALDDALANFKRVSLYPDNPWIPAALYSTGQALERQGKWEEAADAYYRVVAEHPGSPWAPKAQLAVGKALLRFSDPLEALVELQQVRNRYPDAAESERALDLLTLFFRFYAYPELGREIAFEADPHFRLALAQDLKDVRGVRVSDSGLVVLERGRKRVLLLSPEGQLTGTRPAPDGESLSVDPRGQLVVAHRQAVSIGGKPLVLAVPDSKGPKQLEKIQAGARDRLGDLYVYDDGQKQLLRFDSAGALVGPFPDASRREVLQIEIDPSGNVVYLDKSSRSIEVWSPSAERLALIEPRGRGWELKKPGDFALDPAGYLYVLDENQPRLAIFDPSYRLLVVLAGPQLGGGVLEKPTHLDVSASGEIYVYDDKKKTVLRLR